jgi:hypothetical protein
MFQQLLTFLPHKLGIFALILFALASIAGVILWLCGARFSRSILTLSAVGIGTIIGLKLPLWCQWTVDPMGPAVGGAIILGISAFALHRLWVGAWLGVLLTLWTGLLMWTLKASDFLWDWPPRKDKLFPKYLSDLWLTLPPPMQKYLPICAGVCMVVGLASAIVWPKLGTLVMWSFAGVSLLLTGWVTIAQIPPGNLGHLPSQLSSQIAVLTGMTAFGALLQWRMSPRPKSAKSDSSGTKSEKKGD